MNNYKQPGKTLELTAPSGGVVSGTGYLIGGLFVVAAVTAAQTETFAAMVEGVFTLPKTSAQAWAEGDKIYWNTGTDKADNVPTVGPLIGVATAVADNPSGTGVVRLNGSAPDASEGPQAAIEDLTFGTNIAAATANGSLTDSSGTNPTEAQFNELAKELGVKINGILAALRTTGVIASS